jgi:hypothetical protein
MGPDQSGTSTVCRWHDHDSNVQPAFPESGGEVNHIHYQKIGSRRHLNLYTYAYARAVDLLTFHPVDVAVYLLGPAANAVKPSVKQFADGGPSVGVCLFAHSKFETRDRSLYFVDEGRQVESLYAFAGTIVIDPVNDLWHVDAVTFFSTGFLNISDNAAGVLWRSVPGKFLANRLRISSQSTISAPIQKRIRSWAASNVEPPPPNGSKTISPSFVESSMQREETIGLSSFTCQRDLNFW